MTDDRDRLHDHAKKLYEKQSMDWCTRIEWEDMTEDQKEVWISFTESRDNYKE